MAYMNFDDALNSVGSFNKFQKLIVIYSCIFTFFHTENIWINFIGYTPSHLCTTQNEQRKTLEIVKPNISFDNDQFSMDSCYYGFTNRSLIDRQNIDTGNLTFKDNYNLIQCNSWIYGNDYGESLVTRFNLVCHKRWMLDLISTIGMIGNFISSIIFGLLPDIFGRIKALICAMVLKNIGSIVIAFSPDYYMVLSGQFVSRIGHASTFSVLCIYVAELVNNSVRSSAITVLTIAYSVGFVFSALLAYLCNNYQLFISINLIPNFILIIISFMMPESPRWLLSNGRVKESSKIMQKIALINGKECTINFDMIKVDKKHSMNSLIKSMFGNSIILRRCGLVSMCWLTNQMILYTIMYNIANMIDFNVFVSVAVSSALQVPVVFLGMWVLKIKFLGRKSVFVLCFIVTATLSFATMTIMLSGYAKFVSSIIAFVLYIFCTSLSSMLYVYTVELFPTEICSIGLQASKLLGFIGSTVSSFLGGSLTSFWPPLPFIVFLVLSVISITSVMFLPETKNQNLDLVTKDLTKEHNYTDNKENNENLL